MEFAQLQSRKAHTKFKILILLFNNQAIVLFDDIKSQEHKKNHKKNNRCLYSNFVKKTFIKNIL